MLGTLPIVLVVDDDAALRRMLALAWSDYPMELAFAENGMTALEKIRAAPPDLMVLDPQMPVMDGRELAQALRDEGIALPTVIVSSQPDAPAVARELGSAAVVSKPFDPDVLAARVLELVDIG